MMVKALDLIGSNNQLQSHWLRRILAAIIDSIIAFVIWTIIAFMIAIATVLIPGGIFVLPVFTGIIWFLYSAFLEGTAGATIGKRLMSLIVVSTEGPMSFSKALIRNVSKIYGLFLIIDWLVGFVTDGDPRQRFLDRIANTTVVRTDAQEIFHGAYQPPSRSMPSPYSGPSQAPQYQASGAVPGAVPPMAQPGQQPPLYSSPMPPPSQPSYAAEPEGNFEPPPPSNEELSPPPPDLTEGGTNTGAGEMEEKVFTRKELVNLKKNDLIKISREQELPVSGTKRDLIDRILGEEVKE